MLCRPLLISLLGVVALPVLGLGAEDTRRIDYQYQEKGLKVIEEKCLVCHNRKRIEEASRSHQDMEKVQRQMEQKGVVLSDKEKQVMGVFWRQNPFKPEK